MDDRTNTTSNDPVEYKKAKEEPHVVFSRAMTEYVDDVAKHLLNIHLAAERALEQLHEHPEITQEMIKNGEIPHMGWIIGALNDINHNVFHAGRAAEATHAVFKTATEAGVLLTRNGPIKLKVNDG